MQVLLQRRRGVPKYVVRFFAQREKQQLRQENQRAIEEALKKGSKPWGRSKLMIVGEGGAGKTALTNSIMGKLFVPTESTIGINNLECQIEQAALGTTSNWSAHEKSEKEFASALASMIVEEDSSNIEQSNHNPQLEKSSSQSFEQRQCFSCSSRSHR